MKTKQCARCKEEKPLANFYKALKSKDGLQANCKKCQKEASKRGTAKKTLERREAERLRKLEIAKLDLQQGHISEIPKELLQETEDFHMETKDERQTEKIEPIYTSPVSVEEMIRRMPLDSYDDYLHYNEEVRRYRMETRRADIPFKFCPLDKIPSTKVRITRRSNRGRPIHLNIKRLNLACHLKKDYKDGEEVEIPSCMIPIINSLGVPIYKQVKYPNGNVETVMDYVDNKFSCEYVG